MVEALTARAALCLQCQGCGLYRTFAQFAEDPSSPDRRAAQCLACIAIGAPFASTDEEPVKDESPPWDTTNDHHSSPAATEPVYPTLADARPAAPQPQPLPATQPAAEKKVVKRRKAVVKVEPVEPKPAVATQDVRLCSGCREVKRLHLFVKSPNGPDGRGYLCGEPCANKQIEANRRDRASTRARSLQPRAA